MNIYLGQALSHRRVLDMDFMHFLSYFGLIFNFWLLR
jgi:hypothetical protein